MTRLAPASPLLVEVRDLLTRKFGIHYPVERLSDLSRRLAGPALRFGYDDTTHFLSRLLAEQLPDEEVTAVIEAVTVGETYFYRESEAFEALRQLVILPRVKDGGRPLRIWSAGCATGEEAYSLAMFLLEAVPQTGRVGASILATDLNPGFLGKARLGQYSNWSFRVLPEAFRLRYFRKIEGQHWEILPQIRNMVTFARLNLACDPFPSLGNGTHDLDIIFCRNVLMYFAPESIRRIAGQLAAALKPDGWLVVSQTECSDYFTTDFEAVQHGNAFIYRKRRPGEQERAMSRAMQWDSAPNRDSAPITAPPPTSEESFTEARRLANQGKTEQARVVCMQGLSASPLDRVGHFLHAAILQELGLAHDAHTALKKVLYLDPDSIMAHYTLGMLEQRQGNRQAALRALDTAARLLGAHQSDTTLEEAEGLTVGRLMEIIATMRKG